MVNKCIYHISSDLAASVRTTSNVTARFTSKLVHHLHYLAVDN